MVRELVTRCDLCRQRATFVRYPVAIGDPRTRLLDLCASHHAALFGSILDVLDEHGVDPKRPRAKERQRGWKRQTGPYRCLAGCTATPLKSATTLTTHLRLIHSMTFEQYVEQYGMPVPMSADELAELTVEVRCEVDGCEKVYSTELGNRWPQQAMISHMWGHHGIKWRPI